MTSFKTLSLADFDFATIALRKPEIVAVSGLCTPELASELMKFNHPFQRKPTPNRINEYSRVMNSGKWIVAEPVLFDWNGTMVNGQHRLLAVIKSGKPQEINFNLNLPPKVFEVVDQGKNRKTLDILRMRTREGGKPNWSDSHNSIARMVIELAVGIASFKVSFSKQEMATVCEIHQERLDFALQFNKQGTSYAPVLASVVLAYPYENHDRLIDFLECWHTGQAKKGICDNACLWLRNEYMKNKVSKKNQGGIERYGFAMLAQSALSNFLSGTYRTYCKPLSENKWKADEFKPEALYKAIKEFDAKRSADL